MLVVLDGLVVRAKQLWEGLRLVSEGCVPQSDCDNLMTYVELHVFRSGVVA
jgi:hypothetical protein